MAAAVLYGVLTLLAGHFVLENVFHSEHEDRHIFSCFLGMMLLTVLYACLSLFRVGSIFNIKIIDMVLFVLLCIWFMRSRGREGCKRRLNGCLRFSVSKPVYLKLMGVMSFLMIAVGRANNSLDYDSVWYGLRSPYVLNNKTGIYDNLKLVGCVYTYPKGYEVYQLPLSGFDSYGFVYAGNIIMSLAVLYMVYKIFKLFVQKGRNHRNLLSLRGKSYLYATPCLHAQSKPQDPLRENQILYVQYNIRLPAGQ